MVNDRGSIKWTTMMLPEHAEILRELREQQEYKIKPLLDEQCIEENELQLQRAIHENTIVEIKYFKAHGFHSVKGNLRSVDEKGYVALDNEERTAIYFRDIIEVIIMG